MEKDAHVYSKPLDKINLPSIIFTFLDLSKHLERNLDGMAKE